MKRFFYLMIITLLGASSLKAQTTEGKDFWVTFGDIANMPMQSPWEVLFEFQIRIVGGNEPTSVDIYFTNLGTFIHYDMIPYEIYTYSLENAEKYAVYNTSTGITNFSIRVITSNPVSVFASKRYMQYNDITNVLPVTALGTEYYAISYTHDPGYQVNDAYAVVATQNNTLLYHNNTPILPALNAGDVYYRTNSDCNTGDLIISDKPVAFFAQNRVTWVHGFLGGILFQQLAPIITWGKTFFVPVTVCGIEYVRIVAAHDGTTIEQTGGTICTGIPGAQTSLDNLQAGQFVELEILLSNNGCFISADKPVGVCSFMKSYGYPLYNNEVMCSQVWIPAIDQSISKVKMAPFVQPYINNHYALVVTPTNDKDNTRVSIGGTDPVPLGGDGWYNHAKGMSFYNFPLTNLSAPYVFSNPAGIIVLGYGTENYPQASYYYLAGSGMRDLDAAFYANDIHFQDLKDTAFCAGAVEFRAEIEGELHPDPEHLKWYIDGVEYLPARDSLEWDKTFLAGDYEITMEVHYETGETVTKTATLQIASCSYNAGFYANDVYYEDLADTLFCVKEITFTTEIENVGAMTSLNWYINGTLNPALQDRQTWTRSFRADNYVITMEVCYNNGDPQTYDGDLSIGAQINIVPVSSDGGDTNINGGAPNSGGCFKVGSTLYFNATPK